MKKIEIIQIIEEGNTNLYKSGIINKIVYNANLDFINSFIRWCYKLTSKLKWSGLKWIL